MDKIEKNPKTIFIMLNIVIYIELRLLQNLELPPWKDLTYHLQSHTETFIKRNNHFIIPFLFFNAFNKQKCIFSTSYRVCSPWVISKTKLTDEKFYLFVNVFEKKIRVYLIFKRSYWLNCVYFSMAIWMQSRGQFSPPQSSQSWYRPS